MKKLVFLVIFILLSNVLFSQILTQKDIEIFINGIARYWNTVAQIPSWETHEYFDSDRFHREIGNLLWGRAETITLDLFKQAFNGALNRTVPPRLEELYIELGWENNGSRKFWTISTIFVYIQRGINYESANEELHRRFLEIQTIFNQADFELVNSNFEGIDTAIQDYLRRYGGP